MYAMNSCNTCGATRSAGTVPAAFGNWRHTRARAIVHAQSRINPHGHVGSSSSRASSPAGRPATPGGVDAIAAVAAAAAPPPAAARSRQFSATAVLPLLSSAVESAAEVAVFEQLAGRSAMIGLTAAIILEGVTSGPTFATLSPEATAAAAAAAIGSVAAAAIAAAAAARAPPRATDPDAAAAAAAAAASDAAPRAWWWLGAGIHEAVVGSLTSTRGSASGVTQVNVDQAVDFVVDRCLTRSVHPVFGPLDDLTDAGATVATVVDALLRGDNRPDLLQ